jgi:hypothetical protein
MTSARIRRKRQNKPSAPRQIGANDNASLIANDNGTPQVIRGVKLTDNQRHRMSVAEARLATDDLGNRRLGQRMMESLEEEIAAKGVANDVEKALTERRGLEALRGYEIGASQVEGAVGTPKVSRDGLETLLTANAIDRNQHAAGLRYRNDYEAIDPEKGLTPPSIDQTRNIVRGGDGYAQKRREIEERVFGIHCMIFGIEPPTSKEDRRSLPALPAGHPAMRAIHALNHIAGRGDNLGDMTTSGSVKARIREDLIFGLDACAIVYGLE